MTVEDVVMRILEKSAKECEILPHKKGDKGPTMCRISAAVMQGLTDIILQWRAETSVRQWVLQWAVEELKQAASTKVQAAALDDALAASDDTRGCDDRVALAPAADEDGCDLRIPPGGLREWPDDIGGHSPN